MSRVMQKPGYYDNAERKQQFSFHLPKLPSLPKEKLRVLTQKRVLIPVGIVIVNLLALAGMYYAFVYAPTQYTPQAIAKKEAKQQQQKTVSMIDNVKKQVKLPQDEDPVLATVSNVNDLQNQAFFKKAQNGDRLLMYKKNKKIYLYRPSTKQVIAVAPMQFQNPTQIPDQNMASVAAGKAPDLHGKILIQPR